MRQMLAVLIPAQPHQGVAGDALPTAVVHGLEDKMVHGSGGRATAAAIPGSELVLIPGMGHDLPPALFEQLAAVIRRTAARAAG